MNIPRHRWSGFLSALGSGPKETGGHAEVSRPIHQDFAMLNILERQAENKVAETPAPSFLRTAEFEKKLRWTVENPPRDCERWTITPKMAEAMLKWNDRNRPVTPSVVQKYAKAMADGRWAYTGEPIIFSHARLIDGQHRLEAVAASGASIEALVVFGAPDAAFAFIDVGKTRTASNIFAIHGVKNHAIMAAATQWVVGYESGKLGAAASSGLGLDHARLFDSYQAHIGLQDSAWVAHLFAQARLASPSTMCALHYICARKSRKDADQFFRKVGEGLGFSGKKDPAYRLHSRLVRSAVEQEKLGRKTVAALTIKAWNAVRLGRDVGTLKYGFDETFPKAI